MLDLEYSAAADKFLSFTIYDNPSSYSRNWNPHHWSGYLSVLGGMPGAHPYINEMFEMPINRDEMDISFGVMKKSFWNDPSLIGDTEWGKDLDHRNHFFLLLGMNSLHCANCRVNTHPLDYRAFANMEQFIAFYVPEYLHINVQRLACAQVSSTRCWSCEPYDEERSLHQSSLVEATMLCCRGVVVAGQSVCTCMACGGY